MTQLIITPGEFKSRMYTIARMDNPGKYIDTEIVHEQADKLMEEILASLGYSEGIKIFREMTKWYS